MARSDERRDSPVNKAQGPDLVSGRHLAGEEALTLKKLVYFTTLVETGSFSKAAVALEVAQSSVSRVVKSLENDFDVELLYRNGRGIILTDAGKLLDGYARRILDLVTTTQNEVRALGDTPIGRVIIGLPPSVGRVLTLPLVRQFRMAFPKMNLKVVEGHSGHVLEWLSSGKIDVAVLYSAPKSAMMVAEPLVEENLYLIGSPTGAGRPRGTSVSLADLVRLPLVMASQPHGMRVLLERHCAEAGVTLNVECEIDAMPAVIDLVEAGVGFTVLPYAPVHALIKAGRLKLWSIDNPPIKRHLLLVTSTQRPMTLGTRHLARMVRTQVKDLVAEGLWSPS